MILEKVIGVKEGFIEEKYEERSRIIKRLLRIYVLLMLGSCVELEEGCSFRFVVICKDIVFYFFEVLC